jgi:hypothetical protein
VLFPVNAIKNQAMALLFSDEKSDIVIERLEKLFLMNSVSIARESKSSSKETFCTPSSQLFETQKKSCFLILNANGSDPTHH